MWVAEGSIALCYLCYLSGRCKLLFLLALITEGSIGSIGSIEFLYLYTLGNNVDMAYYDANYYVQ